MEPIAGTLLKVGTTLFGLRDKLSTARRQRKQDVADFIESIAASIEGASASLKQQDYPHGRCEEIFAHSNQIQAAIGDLIGQARLGPKSWPPS